MYDIGMETKFLRIVQYYADKGYLTLKKVSWPTNDLLLAPLLNDCFYQNILEYKKVIVTSLDEIIVPRKHDSYSDMVTYLENSLSQHPGIVL